jgi:hypothetical protein
MTLTPINEAIGCENHLEKHLNKGKKYHHDLGGHARCKDSITIREA